jgi:S1-C subfamily serine protease
MTIRNAILALLFTVGASFAVPLLGVTFKKATFENHLALNVIGVHPESGCFTAGMVAGDQIVGVEGQTLTGMAQIQSAVANHKAGQKVKIEIVREGKRKR